jgi:hypothetical protein
MKQNITLIFVFLFSSIFSQTNCDQSFMKIGMGLDAGDYWINQQLFKDYALYKGKWITAYNSSIWDTNEVQFLNSDQDGYPIGLPQDINGHQIFVRMIVTADGYMPIDEYYMLYDGNATLSFQGNLQFIEETDTGKIKFKVTDNLENGYVDILSSPSNNYIKNIRIIPVKYINDYNTQPLHPEFISKISSFAVLRTMDLTSTNDWGTSWGQFDNNINEFLRDREWSERVLPTFYSQTTEAGKGMAYEHIIKLANTLNKDIWINIPHNVSNDYVKNMAQLFKTTLNSNIKVYLEYSNEVWNGQFLQFHWIEEHYNSGRFPQAQNIFEAAGTRAKQLFSIWMNEFSGNESRVIRILGGQAANPWIALQWSNALSDENWDALAITHYFDIENAENDADPQHAFRDRLLALGNNATIDDIVNLAKETYNFEVILYGEDDGWKGNIKLANQHQKPTFTYEGGPHIVYGDNIQNTNLLNTTIQASRSQKMQQEVYAKVIDNMRNWGVTLLMPFLFAEKPSKWGDWGHYLSTFDTQTPPKIQILLDNISPCQTLAIIDESEISSFTTLYPNPFENSVSIVFPNDEIGTSKKIRLYNNLGQLLRKLNTVVNVSSEITLDNLNLNAGLYIITIDQKKGFKLIKK